MTPSAGTPGALAESFAEGLKPGVERTGVPPKPISTGGDLTPLGVEKLPEVALQREAGSDEDRYDFQAVDPNIATPSDFVGFDRFAGLNDDLMRQISDKASSESDAARTRALDFLSQAEREATVDVPMEKTPSYARYMEAMKEADAKGRGFSRATDDYGRITGNPFEDALRGVYASAQDARENRLQDNAFNRGSVSAKNRDLFLKTQADAAAEARKKAELEKAAQEEERKGELTRAEQLAFEQQDPINKRTGATTDDEYAARNRQRSWAGGL